ncbi:MAG: hypothetical protein WC378_07875 [Opitutaceae bacterium]|jgi:hypothetical protein
MELRHFFLVAVLGGLALPLPAAPTVHTYPLDAGIVYPIVLATDEPTTVVFPGALTALDGANIAAQATETAGILLSYQPGQRFFSVCALHEGVKAGLNVVYHEKVYALRFATGPAADRIVTFLAELPAPQPDRLRALIEQVKFWTLRVERLPALAGAVERVAPATATTYRDFTVTLEEVFRWDAEDVLVFHARLENRGTRAVAYDAERLGVRLGTEAWTAAAVDASGAIPAGGVTHVYFAIQTSLPASAGFAVVVSAP